MAKRVLRHASGRLLIAPISVARLVVVHFELGIDGSSLGRAGSTVHTLEHEADRVELAIDRINPGDRKRAIGMDAAMAHVAKSNDAHVHPRAERS